MQTLSSSHLLQYRRLFSDHFPKTHLQKSTVHRQNRTQLGSAFVSRASVSSNAHPIERLASEQLEPVKGLHKLRQWIENQGLKRAAVTNAPRPNGELLISTVELSNFFEIVVVGDECDRAKPFPDPYLKALQALQVSHKHAFAFEDSVSGVKAGVAAGMPVVALGTRNPEISLINAGAAFVIKDFEDPKLWEALEEFESKAM